MQPTFSEEETFGKTNFLLMTSFSAFFLELDKSVESNLCSNYMEALAVCECHPDEGECTEDEMMEDCDYLWDETMHSALSFTLKNLQKFVYCFFLSVS